MNLDRLQTTNSNFAQMLPASHSSVSIDSMNEGIRQLANAILHRPLQLFIDKNTFTILANLQKLAPLFRSEILEKLKYLPLEEIVDLSLKQLYLLLLEKFFSKPDSPFKNFTHMIALIKQWKNPDYFNVFKTLYLTNVKSLNCGEAWEKESATYIEAIEKLVSLPESFQTVLRGPIDESARKDLFMYHARMMNKISEHYLTICRTYFTHPLLDVYKQYEENRVWHVTKAVGAASKDEGQLVSSKTVVSKLEILKHLSRQLDFYVRGKRFNNFFTFLSNPLPQTQNSHFELQHFKTHSFKWCQGILKLVKELRKQYLLTEEFCAFQTRDPFSFESQSFLEKYYRQVYQAQDRLFDQLMDGFREFQGNAAWNSMKGTAEEKTVKNICLFMEMLVFEIRIYIETKFKTENNEPSGRFLIAQMMKERYITDLKKECSPDIELIIRTICAKFADLLDIFFGELSELEQKYRHHDNFFSDPKYGSSVSLYSDCHAVLDEMMNVILEIASTNVVKVENRDPYTIILALINCCKRVKDQTESERLLMFKKYYCAMYKSDDFPYKMEFISQYHSLDEFGENLRNHINYLDVIASAVSQVEALFLKTHAFSQMEADAKVEQFNAQEMEWHHDSDEELDASSASAASEPEKKESISKKKRLKKKKSKQAAVVPNPIASLSHPVVSPPKPVLEQPFHVHRYPTQSLKLLAMHRHQLKKYYRVPDYIVTPMSLREKPFTPADVAIQQQIMSTDCLQWVVRMLESSKNAKVKQLLTSFYFWWIHLATEQSGTAANVKVNGIRPETHRIDTLCKAVGVEASKHTLKGHIWGTHYIRYPFSVPKPSGHVPLIYWHAKNPSETTVNTAMAFLEPMLKEFVLIQNKLLNPTSHTAASQFEMEWKKILEQGNTSAAASAPASKSHLEPFSKEQSSQFITMRASLQEGMKSLEKYIKAQSVNVKVTEHSKAALDDIKFHLDNLNTVLMLIEEQPSQENAFVQMAMAYISTQYFCENWGIYLASREGYTWKWHNLTDYISYFGLGGGRVELISEIGKVNFRKNIEYMFRGDGERAVRDNLCYLSGLFASSKFVMLSEEGIVLPQASKVSFAVMRKEMIERLQKHVSIVMQLIEIHIPQKSAIDG